MWFISLRFLAVFVALRILYDAFLVAWRRDDGDLNSLEVRVATNRSSPVFRQRFAIACWCLKGITKMTSSNMLSRHKSRSECMVWDQDLLIMDNIVHTILSMF